MGHFAIVFMLSLSVVGANLSASESDPRLQQLSDFIELKIGAGEGKRPLVVLLPGCLGWHPHHTMWQNRLLQNAANPKAKKAKLQSKPKPKRKKKRKKRVLLPSTIPSRS